MSFHLLRTQLILIQDDGSISKEALERMVTEINSTQVSKEDLLSNKVQFMIPIKSSCV